MYDAVNVFAHSVGSLDGSSNPMLSANISCKLSNRWPNGTLLYDKLNAVRIRIVDNFFPYFKNSYVHVYRTVFLLFFRTIQVEIEGLTGKVNFDEGKRSNIKLDLLKLHQEKVKKVGFWTPSTGINITRHSVFYGQQSSNVTLIVVTRVVST